MILCSTEGCKNKAHSRTLCNTHYSQHRTAGTLARFPNLNEEAKARPTRQRPKPAKRRLWSGPKCLECEAPPIARQLCGKHYQQAMASGNPPPKVRIKLGGIPCEVSWCDGKAVSRKRCQRHASFARRYNLTTEQMETLPEACEACGSTHRLHVDHCHEREVYRGVLCSDCNTALGLVGDSADRMRCLIKYLEERS